jgi:hypothetical protein
MNRTRWVVALAFLVGASFALAAPRGVTQPTARTLPAETPAPAYIIFRGEVATGGGEAAMWFEYGLSDSLGTRTAEERLRVTTTTMPVSLGVSVEGGRTYFYRVVVKNEVGIAEGETMQATATSPPSLAIVPERGTTRVGSRKQFRALFDADGAGPGGTVDVTERTTWISANVPVASHELGGRFFGKAVGKTTVRALYNPDGPVVGLSDVRNVSADAELSVEAIPLGTSENETDGNGGFGNLPFAILVGILSILGFAALVIVVVHVVKRFRQ